jgi:hypothetical protein
MFVEEKAIHNKQELVVWVAEMYLLQPVQHLIISDAARM